jgi:hypothetical protein
MAMPPQEMETHHPFTPGAVISMFDRQLSPTRADSAPPSFQRGSRSGPWGTLETFPFFLETPPQLLDQFPLPHSRPRWIIDAADAADTLARLTQAGLPSEILEVLKKPDNQVQVGTQIVLFPPLPWLLQLDPHTRAALYRELSRFPANVDISSPCLMFHRDVRTWFANTGLRPELLDVVEQMSYPRGEAFAFADTSVLMGIVSGPEEARRVLATLARTQSLMVRLVLNSDTKLDQVMAYWSTELSRRTRDISALLQSLVDSHHGGDLDVAHLLPGIPRKLLFTYPDLTMAADGELPDCHWTSLNFFNSLPEPFFLDSRLATSVVLERYTSIEDACRFGDVLIFIDNETGNAFHSCVYIADDVVFTKNGRNVLSPWVFQTLDQVRRIYLHHHNGHIKVYRQTQPAAK